MSIREAALRRALTQVGTKEQPLGSNWGTKVSEYLKSVGITSPAAWCLAFVHWSYAPWTQLPGGGLVQAFDDWATKAGEIVRRPLRGDIVCYDWNGDRWDDHVGLVVRVLALRWRNNVFVGWVKTVEGNTGAGEVAVCYRWIGRGNTARFVRVKGLVPA